MRCHCLKGPVKYVFFPSSFLLFPAIFVSRADLPYSRLVQPHIDPEDIPRILDMQRKVEAQIAERRAGRAAWRRDWRQFAKQYGRRVQEKCEIWMGLDKEVERSSEHIEEVIRRMEAEQGKLVRLASSPPSFPLPFCSLFRFSSGPFLASTYH